MKTEHGEVLSTKSVSLSQAARTIAAFVSADNGGASQAVGTYLKRTSAAFNELLQFHKDHKTHNFKIKKSRVDAGNSDRVRVKALENGGEKNKKKCVSVDVEGDSLRKKEKHKKEEIEDEERGSEGKLGNVKNVVGGEGDRKVSGGDGEGQEDEKKEMNVAGLERNKEKKKNKSGGVERGSEGSLGNVKNVVGGEGDRKVSEEKMSIQAGLEDFLKVEMKKEKKKNKSGGGSGERGSEGSLGSVKNVVGGEGDRKVSSGGDGEGHKDKERKKIEAMGSENFNKVDDFEMNNKKKKNKNGGGERGSDDNLRIKEKGKKRKSEEGIEGETGNSSEQSGHKKKKRRRAEADD